jgi:hypothetical protein
MPTPDDDDVADWLRGQAELLRLKRFAEDFAALDWDHLAEEVENLHRYERTQITGHLRVLCLHLLRWAAEPAERGEWRGAVTDQRLFLDGFWDVSPSLRAEWPALLAAASQDARRFAAKDTGLPVETFPTTCPCSLAQLRDDGFWPAALGA